MLGQNIKVLKAQRLTIENSRKTIKDKQEEKVLIAQKNRKNISINKEVLDMHTNQATKV